MSLLLLVIGFLVGTFGTLIGAGGGFLLMPVLLLMYPQQKPEVLTAISLMIVFLNALSGSVAYFFKKRIDYKSALIFSIASAPGAFLGAYTIQFISRDRFEFIFGFIMLSLAAYLLFPRKSNQHNLNKSVSSPFPAYKIIDFKGDQFLISYNPKIGIAISMFVGFVSSLLGIGGGIIHVPALVHVLNFPIPIATATSHSILAVMSALGTAEHIHSGHLDLVWLQVLYLGLGVIIGAQLGAYFSSRIKGEWVMRALAMGLISVGLRFIFF